MGLMVLGLLLVGLSTPLAALAGLRMVAETHEGGVDQGGATPQVSNIFFEGKSLRIQPPRKGKQRRGSIVIFRADKDVLWAVDPSRRSYVELSTADMRSLAVRMEEVNAQMDAALKGMSPEQQAQARKMMDEVRPNIDTSERERATVVKLGDKRKVDGMPARRVDVKRGAELIGEIWLTDWENVGVSSEQFEVFRKFAAFQQTLMDTVGVSVGGRYGAEGYDAFDQLDGFPLRVKRLKGGAVVSETRFKDIVEFASPDGFFDVPRGFRKVVDTTSGKKPPAPATTPSAPPTTLPAPPTGVSE